MHKSFLVLLVSSAISITHAQSNLDVVLSGIQQNNKTIAAAQQYVEAKSFEFRTGNTPNNPSVSADYLIGKPVAGGNQFDFQVVQEFDFPTAYKFKGALADSKIELLQIELNELRQNVLFEAKTLGLEVIYLNQYKAVILGRLNTSKGIVANYQKKYDAELISALELNKAKIQKLTTNSQLRKIESRLMIATEKLTELNGGIPISLADTLYSDVQLMPTFEVLHDTIEVNDPKLTWFNQQTEVFQTQLRLSKSMVLPKFETGYHYQTVLGQTFNGVHMGLTIPLWQQKNTVKASRASVEMNTYQIDNHKTEHYYYIRQLYSQYEITLSIISEYKTVLDALNSEEILYQSLELGEIDFITYATELEYYYKAKDDLLSLEKEHQMIVAELFKYQL